MNKELKYLILFSLLTLFGCGNEEDAVSGIVPPQAGETLQLTVSAADFVTDGAPDTRATDNDRTTTFEEGDRVGVIILDEGDGLLYNNIPYVYQNNKWTFDSNNDDGKGGCYYDPKAKTYIVYYPYSRAADEVRSKEDLKTKFAPKFNQSDIKDYRSSDLMVWDNSSLTPPVTALNAELTHAFASISLTPKAYILDDGNSTKGNAKVSDVSLTIDDNVYVPYQATDGSLRCIVPASINLNSIRCFYTFSGKTYGNTINISDPVANTRYISAPEIFSGKYTLNDAKVGDFYCKKNEKEGYLIPSEVALNDDQKNACLGIVFWVGSEAFDEDPFLKNDHSSCSHGLVVALQDAALNGRTYMKWSEDSESVQNSVDNIYNSSVNTQNKDIMCGYSNTLALMAYNEAKGAGNRLRVLPCAAIEQYSKNNPTPTNSSGWYFPSVMELKYVCWGQGKGQGIIGRDNLNTQIGVSNGSPFGSVNYWSSTEASDYNGRAWYVGFDGVNVYFDHKFYYTWRVRPLLAF